MQDTTAKRPPRHPRWHHYEACLGLNVSPLQEDDTGKRKMIHDVPSEDKCSHGDKARTVRPGMLESLVGASQRQWICQGVLTRGRHQGIIRRCLGSDFRIYFHKVSN
ncbi:uncharacterized protein SPSK_10597 [Sporothrix schenckii 1099-18]|uniref:Uncharacterized protein n=1 Tax=Sporothrix schenckii 1099-18 TaxID=1397361 RepID=A0A0F2M478_SPOSC|nr:uncharacterized protein SPSK_10597 [Sporothrix schenckii 1099-18]KJR83610.1 hypothetical protein SPSK_10597 [Sporothrix schenckii 1099-18]